MKKTIISLMLACMAFMPAVSAESTYLFTEYGACSYADDFENVTDTSMKTYPYFISGNGTASVCEGMNGGRGIGINAELMNEGESEDILFSFHQQSQTARPDKENYYFEIFVKGLPETPSNIVPYYKYESTGGGRTAAVIDFGSEPAQDGWVKLWYRVPILKGYLINGHAGWRYTKKNGDAAQIVFDNFAMRPIPQKLEIYDAGCRSDRGIDLSALPVSGISAGGVLRSIKNRQQIKWNVISGNAEIIGGRLVPKSDEPQEIRLEADFFGVKEKVSVFSDKYVGEHNTGDDNTITARITKGTEYFAAEVSNSGTQQQTVYFMTAAYAKGRLYKVNAEKILISAGQMQTVKCDVPKMAGGIDGDVTVRAFVWSGSDGMNRCAEFE